MIDPLINPKQTIWSCSKIWSWLLRLTWASPLERDLAWHREASLSLSLSNWFTGLCLRQSSQDTHRETWASSLMSVQFSLGASWDQQLRHESLGGRGGESILEKGIKNCWQRCTPPQWSRAFTLHLNALTHTPIRSLYATPPFAFPNHPPVLMYSWWDSEKPTG